MYQIVELADQEEETSWFVDDVRHVIRPLIRKYEKNGKCFVLTENQLDDIASLAQDVVSFRGGSNGMEAQDIFFEVISRSDSN